MADKEQLEVVGEDLIEVFHPQAKEEERLIAHLEPVTTRLPESSELSAVRSCHENAPVPSGAARRRLNHDC
jgi:hypothetical protein